MLLSSELEKDLKKLKIKYAKRFSRKSINNILDYNDFLQEAEVAVLQAEKNFDPEKGSFLAYVDRTIHNELLKKALQCNSILSVKQNAVLLAIEIYHLENEGIGYLDILEKLNITAKRYQEVKNLLYREAFFGECIVYPEPEQIIHMSELFNLLKEKDQEILKMYLDEHNLVYIGRTYNRSKEWARLKIKKILNEIRIKYDRE